jgi:hypothetical protein
MVAMILAMINKMLCVCFMFDTAPCRLPGQVKDQKKRDR